MHLFSSDPFLSAFAEAHRPGRPFVFGRFEVDGHHVRLPIVDGRPVTGGPFFDFCPALEPGRGQPAARLGFVPRVAVDVHEAEERPEFPAGTWPAPFIAWSRFNGWKAFEAHYAAQRRSLVREGRAKRRRLEQELGPLAFVRSDVRPHVLERCFAWKSAQYVATGLPDLFRRPANLALFHGLRRRGALVVSSLSAGDRLIAVHAGVALDRTFSSWLPAYDAALASFSPGRLLMEELMRASLEAGDAEFDFLIGDEPYKWHYATHWRRVTSAGRPPLAARLLAASRGAARSLLERHPGMLARARSLKNRLAERGVGG